MNADRLLALFEQISEAPDAIPRLRRFILDLAVRGKLVEQDPQDEPVIITITGALLAATDSPQKKGRRKASWTPPLDNESKELPLGWHLFGLAELVDPAAPLSYGVLVPGDNVPDGVPFVRAQDLMLKNHPALPGKKIAKEIEGKYARTRLKGGEILICVVGSIGKIGVVPEHWSGANIARAVARLKLIPEVSASYMLLVLQSGMTQGFFKDSTRTLAQPTLNISLIEATPIPLPPLAEQQRIVAKVDELIALCDQLEAARRQRVQCRECLLAASLQRLNQPSDDPEAFRSDARFALQVLPSLTTTPAQLKQLRQTILNLAVRGKLVEQEPEDEPAIDLLTELKRVRDIRVTLGELKAPRKSLVAHDKSKMALSPPGWTWAHASDLWDFENGDRSKNYPSKDQFVDVGVPFVNAGHLVDGVVDMSRMNFISREKYELLSGGKLRQGDQLFCLRGSLGKHAVYLHQYEAAIASSLVILRPIIEDLVPYLKIYLDSDIALDMLRRHDNGTAQPNLSSANLKMFEVPIPPLAEQHRIVAKVDELMTLCDQLEQQLSQGEESRHGLLEAVLQEALVEPRADLALVGRA